MIELFRIATVLENGSYGMREMNSEEIENYKNLVNEINKHFVESEPIKQNEP